MLALLTDRRLKAGLPFDRGEESGLGPLLKRLGFLGKAGLAAAGIFGLGGTLGGIFIDSGSSNLAAAPSGDEDFSLVKVPCLPIVESGGCCGSMTGTLSDLGGLHFGDPFVALVAISSERLLSWLIS